MRSSSDAPGMLKNRKSANESPSSTPTPFSLQSGTDLSRSRMLEVLEQGSMHGGSSRSPSRTGSAPGGTRLPPRQQYISSPIPIGSPRQPHRSSSHTRACRLSSVPLVQLQSHSSISGGEEEHFRTSSFPQSSTRRRSAASSVGSSDPGGLALDPSSHKGGMCSVSDTMESLRGGGTSPLHGPPILGPHQGHLRIKHLTRNQDGSSRFPKLDECAHFHYENVELGPLKVSLPEERCEGGLVVVGVGKAVSNNGADKENEGGPAYGVQVNSNRRSFVVRRTYDNFRMLDRQLHRCVYDRKYSLLEELPPLDRLPENQPDREEALRGALAAYLERFSQLAGSLINCGTVLNWLELDNRGHRLIVTDEAAINTPAVAAAYVVKRHRAQAPDEISFEVGDMVSVIDMPPPDESSWWRGKKGFEVGFFPCECVEVIGEKVPHIIKVPKTSSKPVLRKHGKLIAFFRSFLLSRPSRRKLKQSGILKERVFGCDLGEHLMNTGRDIPLVLKSCTEFIEAHGVVDGIYRLSGVTSNIQKLRLAFDEDRVPDLVEEAIIQDIHCVASLLKMYFRELPNPLLTYQLYDKFVRAVQSEDEVRLLRLRDIVQQLPPPHYRTLEYLIRHLARVAAFGHQTGMTPKNVAIVWAPNLLRSKDLEGCGVGALHVVGVQAVLTEYLIRYADLLFSEKMPLFQSPGLGNETPRRTRPKSLAISTPTKLLTLEEARSRVLAANLPQSHQKYIDVGGGPDKLPPKYHTVIDLPLGKRGGSGKLKKSPSGWKSLFSRGSTTRDKERSARKMVSPRKASAGSLQYPSLPMQLDKGSIDFPGSHTNIKKLRTVKSAESLVSLGGGTSCRSSRALDSSSPLEFSKLSWPPCEFPALECLTTSKLVSPPKSPSNHKHMRSVSHDSYFELLEQENNENDDNEDEEEDEDGMDEDKGFQLFKEVEEQINRNQELRALDFGSLLGASLDKVLQGDFSSLKEDDTKESTGKVTRKQKLHSSDSDVGSPKMQKMSKKFRQMSGSSNEDAKTTDSELPVSERPMDVTQEVDATEKICRTVVERYGNEATVVVEVHATQEISDEEGQKSVRNSVVLEDRLPPHRECSLEDSEGGNSLSVDVTDSLSTSHLQSFEGPDHLVLSENYFHEDRNFFSPSGMDTSLETPDSPTMANISEMPSSGSDVSGDEDRLKDFEQPAESTRSSQGNDNQSSHLHLEVTSKEIVGSEKILVEEIRIERRMETSTMDFDLKKSVELSLETTITRSYPSPERTQQEEVPAPPSPCRPDLAVVLALATHYIDTSDSSTGSLTSSRPTGSGRRKSSGERSPPATTASPLDDSRRKFESEIGRSLIRDHQMRLEMEQIQAEGRQQRGTPEVLLKQESPSHHEEVVELRRHSPAKTDAKRNSEPAQRPKSCHQPQQSPEECKRFSEPTSPVPKYLLSEMKSVKQLLCRFESQEGEETSPVSSPTSKKSPVLEDPCLVLKSKQPSLFTQLKVLKLQGLSTTSPSSAEKVDPWSDPILDLMEESEAYQKVLPALPLPSLDFKTSPQHDFRASPVASPQHDFRSSPVVSPQHEFRTSPVASPQHDMKGGTSSEFKATLQAELKATPAERPATLDIGNKAGASPGMASRPPRGNQRKSSPPDPSHPTAGSPRPLPRTTPTASPPPSPHNTDPITPTDPEPEESEATRRERIDKYKEERRAQLREKLRSESFRVEAEEKEKVQNEFRVRKGSGGGAKPGSPTEPQQQRRRSLSPLKKGAKNKTVSEPERSKSSPGTPVLETSLDLTDLPKNGERRPSPPGSNANKGPMGSTPPGPDADKGSPTKGSPKDRTQAPKGVRERAAIFECAPRQPTPSQRPSRH